MEAKLQSSGAETAVENLAEHAYSLLEEAITTLELAPGSVVSEAQLSKRFRIGRSPIRVALQRLASAGLVVILQRRGILIPEIDARSLVKLLEVRREIERLVTAGAAERASPGQRWRFSEIADEMEKTAKESNGHRLLQLDAAYCDLLLAAARNDWASKTIRLMQPALRRFWYVHNQREPGLPLAARLHAEVARQIASGDKAAAQAASDKRFDYIETLTRTSLLE